MATLTREIERPLFLDPPPREPLSVRLRGERTQTAHVEMPRGGGATLDELLVGAWEGLSADRPVVCPVCRGAMHAGARGAGGGCEDCGAQIR